MSKLMPEVIEDVDRTRSAILAQVSIVGTKPTPVDVIEALIGRGFAEDLVRAVLWYLMDSKELFLTRDWVLMRPGVNGTHHAQSTNGAAAVFDRARS